MSESNQDIDPEQKREAALSEKAWEVKRRKILKEHLSEERYEQIVEDDD